jgi:hypothetical protein
MIWGRDLSADSGAQRKYFILASDSLGCADTDEDILESIMSS